MAQTSLSAFKSTALPLSSIVPLDFHKIHTELPSSHAWPSSYLENHPLESIHGPIIDISDPNPNQLVQLRSACEKWGFFQIINHGVSEVLLNDLKMEMSRMFVLPMEVKLQALRPPHKNSGYGGVPIVKSSPNKIWHEGFGIMESLYEHALKLWPSNGNPEFCQVMEEYQQTMKALAERVLTLMLTSVGLIPDDANWAEPKTKESPFGPHGAHLQLNSYPPCPNPTHTMGLIQHTDSSIITVLNQVNNISGLQALHEDKWVTVQPILGAFVVNCGDLAHILFNGQFVSLLHRVVPSLVEHRYFYMPPPRALFAPLSKLVGPGSMPLYRAITWQDYKNAKHELWVAEKVLELIRNDKV